MRRIPPSLRKRQAGVALILVLLAIVFISFLVVLFYTLATTDRTGTAAFGDGLKVDELGAGGLELVMRELRKEIEDPVHSTVNVATKPDAPSTYLPRDPKYILPERKVTDAKKNLLKVSRNNEALYTGGTPLASNSSSVQVSRNGRSVSLDRWKMPKLADFDQVSAPDWIYLTRKGAVANPAVATAREKKNEGFVLGRVAFAIYETGGLLDVNAAGYPAELSDAEMRKKGSIAFARLQAVLGEGSESQVKALLDFRNSASKADYLTYVRDIEKHQGFKRTLPGDNRFLSRQELIRFAKNNGFEDKLYLLNVFSREKNAPSFQPERPDATNPSFATLRHEDTEKLTFERRFPLRKIELFENPAANADDLKKYFGLIYNAGANSGAGGYNYVDAQIKTARQIASEPTYRMPNFFETLKAAIESGSLGFNIGPTSATPFRTGADAQIMQIGANIIDQYDKNYLPTAINFENAAVDPLPILGTENLPYVNKLMFIGEVFAAAPYPFTVGSGNPRDGKRYNFRWGVELWNPHVYRFGTTYNPYARTSPYQYPAATAPRIRLNFGEPGTMTRVDIYKTVDAEEEMPGDKLTGTPFASGNSAPAEFGVNDAIANSLDISFHYFVEPRLLRMGQVNDGTIVDASSPGFLSAKLNFLSGAMYIQLSVRDPLTGTWYPYHRTWSIRDDIKMSRTPESPDLKAAGSSGFIRSDPRTNRGGMLPANFRPTLNSIPAYSAEFVPNTLRWNWSIRMTNSTAAAGSVASTGVVPTYPGLLYENRPNLATYHQDPDGKTRQADGGFAPGTTFVPTQPVLSSSAAVGSYLPNQNPSRPIMLDQPFRSVADLGYAFRDQPWKSLNFSSEDSADAALLDVFCLDAKGDETTKENFTVGKVNLNTRHPEVLTAILTESQLFNDPADPGQATGLGKDKAKLLADKIVAEVNNDRPLQNLAEFVTRLSTSDTLTEAILGTNRGIKSYRESPIRALAGATQTRTWNVMIDLVAQSGRFAPGATKYDDFVVEGERRYWLHLAIDRFTGEIIDENLELVTE